MFGNAACRLRALSADLEVLSEACHLLVVVGGEALPVEAESPPRRPRCRLTVILAAGDFAAAGVGAVVDESLSD